MKAFHYIAKVGPETQVEGVVEGESVSGVSRALISKGLFPVEVVEIFTEGGVFRQMGTLKGLRQRIERRPLNSQSLALFTRRLGDLLDAGLPMQKAMDQLHGQTRDRALKNVLRSAAFRVKSGESLSAALSGYGPFFPRSLIGAIEAGETGGGLITILQGLAELYEKEDDLERTLKAALLYPTLVLFISATTLVVMFTYLLPKLSVLYSDLGQELPGPTQFLIGTSAFFQSFGSFVLVGGFLLLLGLAIFHARSPRFQKLVATAVLKTPVVGRIVLNREIVRFAHTLASLVSGGVPLMRGLWFVSRCSGNAAIVEEISDFGNRVGEGASLSQVISESRLGESVLVMMIQVGEEMGDLAQSLEKACHVYERELRDKMKVITTVLEPMLIVFLGLVVGFIVFSMMLPIMELDLVQ
ncbi:MAG: type II secretion system F family protein [Candidatus Krumholzibacteria bacterium]|nr:type II secretion system F family protein [Candidatus Krumholzibacteria bacterium]